MRPTNTVTYCTDQVILCGTYIHRTTIRGMLILSLVVVSLLFLCYVIWFWYENKGIPGGPPVVPSWIPVISLSLTHTNTLPCHITSLNFICSGLGGLIGSKKSKSSGKKLVLLSSLSLSLSLLVSLLLSYYSPPHVSICAAVYTVLISITQCVILQ